MGEGEGGRRLREPLARRGVDKMKTLWSPSPSSPPTEGRGDFWKNISNQLWTPE